MKKFTISKKKKNVQFFFTIPYLSYFLSFFLFFLNLIFHFTQSILPYFPSLVSLLNFNNGLHSCPFFLSSSFRTCCTPSAIPSRRDYPAGSFAKSRRRSKHIGRWFMVARRLSILSSIPRPPPPPPRNSCPVSKIFLLSFLLWIFRCANTPWFVTRVGREIRGSIERGVKS